MRKMCVRKNETGKFPRENKVKADYLASLHICARSHLEDMNNSQEDTQTSANQVLQLFGVTEEEY